jgi:phosphate starvation-inducible protein PhoH and related proteins
MSPTRSSKKRNNSGIDINDNTLSKGKSVIKTILGRKIEIKAKNKRQKDLLNLIGDKEITFVAGPAGSGKTFLTLAKSLQLIYDETTPYDRIYLLKSVITLQEESIGFIKGEIDDKLKPSVMSFLMNLNKLIDISQMNKLVENDIVVALPIGYMRGLSIDNSIIILDEVQNITLENLRTIMTRIGENSKIIAMGDLRQIDIKNKTKSSLYTAMDLFQGIDEIGTFEFSEEDIVRNPLIQKIERRFEEYFANNITSNKRDLLNG